jgi:hypothetical protein
MGQVCYDKTDERKTQEEEVFRTKEDVTEKNLKHCNRLKINGI